MSRKALLVGRWLPFVVLAAISLWYAADAPAGRKPFSFSLDVSSRTLAHVAIKPIHFRAYGVLCWLAILAVGARRIPLAIGLTLLLSFAGELAQATVVGHNAQLADMLPNVIGTFGAAVLFASGAALIARRPKRDAARRRSTSVLKRTDARAASRDKSYPRVSN